MWFDMVRVTGFTFVIMLVVHTARDIQAQHAIRVKELTKEKLSEYVLSQEMQ